MGAQHFSHGLLLGLAQLREFLGNVGNRTVVLADLHTVDRPADPGGGGDVASLTERTGNPLSRRFDGAIVRALGRLNTGQDCVDTAPGEGANGIVTAEFPELADGCGRQVVIGVVELGPARAGQSVALGGTTTSHLLPGRRRDGLGVARVDQSIEVPPHAGGRKAQPVTDLTGGNGPRFQQQAHNGAAGVTIRPGSRGCGPNCGHGSIQLGLDFHNTSVTQFQHSV